ncbi:MAG: hypothetical protein HY720_21800 [Planctomycetes bacterium]|nr:hypothetical protein [Planctomycetota bacterium]
MSCAVYQDVAVLALFGEAGPEELEGFRRHIANCQGCREEQRSRRGVVRAGRAVLGPVEPPARAVERIVAVAKERRKESRCAGRPLLRLGTTIAAGTAFATLCLAFASSPPSPSGVKIAAAGIERATESAADTGPAEAEIDRRVEEIGIRVALLRDELAASQAASIDAGTARVSARIDELRLELALDEF